MYLMKKGDVPKQAHVGIPEGLYEEEHGREGFSGPASHLYRTHPPTGWVRIDGALNAGMEHGELLLHARAHLV